ncbi:MAG: lysophospholipid acyltransferase family protein [Longimicrobiales bacterium]|nr:lysophospholipid acyltransferase family protein [Longimicrobiales bacterium]
MNTLRTALVALFSTAWYSSRIVLSAVLRSPRFAEVSQELPRRWARAILRAARVQVRVEGLEHFPPDRSAILVANHESWFDVLALVVHVPAAYRFVGKVEITRVPLFGHAWVSAGHIAVDRSDRARAVASLERAGQVLHQERVAVVMFPEGTRSPDGSLLPFKKGAFVLAAQTGVPLVPAGISGSRGIMPKGSLRVRPGTIHLRFGAPIPTEGRGVEERDALLTEARAAVTELRRRLPGKN